jgi:hypothetical protein
LPDRSLLDAVALQSADFLRDIRGLGRPLATRTPSPRARTVDANYTNREDAERAASRDASIAVRTAIDRWTVLDPQWIQDYATSAKISLGRITDEEAIEAVRRDRRFTPFMVCRLKRLCEEAARARPATEPQTRRSCASVP